MGLGSHVPYLISHCFAGEVTKLMNASAEGRRKYKHHYCQRRVGLQMLSIGKAAPYQSPDPPVAKSHINMTS